MPVIKNMPWKPGHPFLGGAIVFRQSRPDSSEKPLTDEGQPQAESKRQLTAEEQAELTAMKGRMKNFQGCIPGSNPPEEEE